jgi:head-tail adaptor
MPVANYPLTVPTASRRMLVQVFGPGSLQPDGSGGWIEAPTPLDPPTWRCEIHPASVRDLERKTNGAVTATATYVLTGRYHPGIDTQTTVVFQGRTFYVNGVMTPDERRIETIAFCSEQHG